MTCLPRLPAFRPLACLLAALLLGGAAASPVSASPDEELLAGARQRIEQHRKADVSVRVVDAAGRPVRGARVQLEQTRHAFLFGSNIFMWGRFDEPALEEAYRTQFAEVFNFATLPFYWWSYEREAGRPNHERTAEVARWCLAQGITPKGHPLAWNYAEPAWLPEDLAEVRRLQMARVGDCVRRFEGTIDIWDVVNEATHFDREECARRAPRLTAMWQQTGQVEFVRQAFRAAREAGPRATLLVNDYRVDPAYEKIIEQLADDEGRPLYDVIGIQSHMHGGVWNNQRIWDVCQRFARFGVPLHFTELTVLSGRQGWERARDEGSWPTTEEGEAAQARDVERIYTMLFSHPAVEAITWWDFSDRGAWQRAPAGFLRADMSPKPAYEVLRRLIKDEWWTRTSAETGDDGGATLRGILGEYRVTVAAADGRTATAVTTLRRDRPNEVTIQLP